MENDIKAEIARKSAEVLQKIKADSRLSHYVPTDRIPSVFMGTDDIRKVRLVVIGQDPTVKNEASRETIETVLNLDKPRGSLYKYISLICEGLGLDLCRHVYATNYAKNFFIFQVPIKRLNSIHLISLTPKLCRLSSAYLAWKVQTPYI